MSKFLCSTGILGVVDIKIRAHDALFTHRGETSLFVATKIKNLVS